jgi:hypothetical protein
LDVEVCRSNAREIETYLEILVPKFEPTGGIPDLPISRKERGGSRDPMPPHILNLWLKNVHAGRINHILYLARNGEGYVKIKGRKMYEILDDCLYDHTAIRLWKDIGGVEEKRFYHMCLLLAYLAADEFDTPNNPYEITVYTYAEDEQLRPPTRNGQKVNTFYTRRQMVEQLEELEERLGEKGEHVMRLLCEAKRVEGKDWSVPKLRKAREVVNRARAQGRREVLA